ncbi:hypothetical protein ERO13_A03G049750v2 [Gossypium hirsutum]|uniref:Uncharacterized protein n=1 Tax=Gossypium darwinii TaxID=34276 RepID=A0A5D2H0Y1_GOSDA|nr:hypothetical protein ERO13_A03G049750v2 [Gossypium hirsutum]TYH24125.1 hypothetical protein ES288_A03G066300v1 [Gossypium darwinii]
MDIQANQSALLCLREMSTFSSQNMSCCIRVSPRMMKVKESHLI